ncbi:MAG: cobyric acid synthase CobQ, partial [Anaerovoracaceae bacterium]
QASKGDGISQGNVYGSYVHGIFDKEGVAGTIITALLEKKGMSGEDVASFDLNRYKEEQYDKLAQGLRESLDMKKIYEILEAGV